MLLLNEEPVAADTGAEMNEWVSVSTLREIKADIKTEVNAKLVNVW